MPAPEPYSMVAIAVISIVPVLILATLLYMYQQIGRAGLVGRRRGSSDTADRV